MRLSDCHITRCNGSTHGGHQNIRLNSGLELSPACEFVLTPAQKSSETFAKLPEIYGVMASELGLLPVLNVITVSRSPLLRLKTSMPDD